MSDPNMEKMFADLFGSGFGSSKTDSELGAELVRENQKLKKQNAELVKTIETLRESKEFYQRNFNKAKAAYQKEVDRRKAREAQEIQIEIDLQAHYNLALAAHESRADPGWVFPSYEEWKRQRP